MRNTLRLKQLPGECLLALLLTTLILCSRPHGAEGQDPARIDVAPQAQTAPLGSNVTFECRGNYDIFFVLDGSFPLNQEANRRDIANPREIFTEFPENPLENRLFVLASVENNRSVEITCLSSENVLNDIASNPVLLTVFGLPLAPTNLTVVGVSTSELELNWMAPFTLPGENVTYIVEITNQDTGFSTRQPSEETEYTFAEPENSPDCSPYMFSVFADNAVGESESPSNVVSKAFPTAPEICHFPVCVPDGLVEEGSSVDNVDEGCAPGDSGVLTSAGTGRACYNGTTEGSVASYACNCPSLYKIVGAGTRTCQSDGTWSGSVPQCLPECAFIPDPPLRGSNEPAVTCSSTSSLISAEYGCTTTHFNTTICHWPEAPSCAAGLSVGAAVGITIALTLLVSFSAGLFVAFVIAYCYIRRQKSQYSPRDTQQPTLTQALIPLQQESIELRDNISYRPVTSRHPAPQQITPLYEELVTHEHPGNIEVRANVAYRPISH